MVAAPAVSITEKRFGATTVLCLEGPILDPALMVGLARDLLANRVDGGHVVLDLDGVDDVDPTALCSLLARLGASSSGVPIPTVVSDAGMRRLLRACGSGPAGLACFGSLEEAADLARPTGVVPA
jgi:hypothetical protein